MAAQPKLHVFGADPATLAHIKVWTMPDGSGIQLETRDGPFDPSSPCTGVDAILVFGLCPALNAGKGVPPFSYPPAVLVADEDEGPSAHWIFERQSWQTQTAWLPAVQRALIHGRCVRALAETRTRGQEVTTRFNALAGSIPGLMFQMQWQEGRLSFFFSSGGALQLLGLPPGALLSDGACFLDMIAADDRADFETALSCSAHEGGQINWEGRLTAPEGDVKWINVRGSTRVLADGSPVWEGVMLNITRGKRAELQLRESRQQLAELSNHLQYAKEDERERIAREVHDLLGGHLVALKFEVSFLGNGDKNGAGAQRLQSIGRLIDEAIETVGRVTRELRPGILRDFGLPAAIECQAEDFSARTGITCHVTCDDDFPELPEMEAITLFRILQEALTNILKHAQATTVDIALAVRDGSLVLMINDNGNGIHSEDLSKPRSFGLRGMKERIASLGGSLDISRISVRGTRLEVSLPMANTSFDQ